MGIETRVQSGGGGGGGGGGSGSGGGCGLLRSGLNGRYIIYVQQQGGRSADQYYG